MGNTTLFLDVYPLHVFYMQQGFGALESCLDMRKDIYYDTSASVLWPVEQEKRVAVDDGRTIGFRNNPLADLSNIEQRMPFVLKAAAQFHQLLQYGDRYKIEQAIREIAAGRGVQ